MAFMIEYFLELLETKSRYRILSVVQQSSASSYCLNRIRVTQGDYGESTEILQNPFPFSILIWFS